MRIYYVSLFYRNEAIPRGTNAVFNVLSESMSQEHITIIKKLSEPKRDEELATELNVKETVVRTLLNDLHMKSLVEYERTKNKKTGWYTYTWRKRDDKIAEYIQMYIQTKIDGLNRDVDAEKNGSLFKCSCSQVNLESAMESNFVCPQCDEPYKEYSNLKDTVEVETEIARLNKLLKAF
jgi:transcription factor E